MHTHTHTHTQKVICGDNIAELKKLPDNYADSIVTDAPYGLGKEPDAVLVLKDWVEKGYHEIKAKGGFMGKSWDSFVPQPLFWKEVFRVLKPGGHVLCFFGTRTYDWGVMAIRIAGFEIRDCIQWLYGCLSEDTRCLTKRGYISYDKLRENDIIAEWDSVSGQIHWNKLMQLLVYDAPEKMIHLQNRHTDQLLTANHRVYANIKKHSRNTTSSGYEVIAAGELKRHWQKKLPLAGNLICGISIPDAYMVGWWLTDAWMHQDGKACMFSQSKPATRQKLLAALRESDCAFSEYIKTPQKTTHKTEYTYYVTGKLAEYLIANFNDRELKWDTLSWDYNSRLHLLNGLIDGDGSNKENKAQTFWSKKESRLEIVAALCCSLNYRSHIDYKKGCVYLNRKTNTSELQSKHTTEVVAYNGEKVWCIKTKYGAFVAMRNGRNFITGNSGFPKSYNVANGIEGKLTHGSSSWNTWQNMDGEKQDRGLGYSTLNAEQGNRPTDYAAYGQRTSVINYTTDEAKQWDGWGTALKPANEPIVLARKPLIGTVVENILEHGVGGINIDACRIPSDEVISNHSRGCDSAKSKGKYGDSKEQETHQTTGQRLDRFPSNVILDEDAGRVLDEQTGVLTSGAMKKSYEYKNNGFSLGKPTGATKQIHDSNSGGASRFFYCAKTSQAERNKGLDAFELKENAHSTYGIHTDEGLQNNGRNPENRTRAQRNNHPTVKPISLMRYLVRLITPPGGLCIDPFNGSGTTGIACKLESINYIGIDDDEEYCKISEARIAAWEEKIEKKDVQIKLEL